MALNNRYEFVLLFDVQDGNPNGDPDAGNLPRVDAETNNGLVTDVCLKRKVRNYVGLAQQGKPGYDIYVAEKAVLTNQQKKAYEALNLENKPEHASEAKAWMCQNFFDVRTFGAVMALKEFNAGQVRGPVQMTFARSVDPVLSSEHAITRMAVATVAEAEKQSGASLRFLMRSTANKDLSIPFLLIRRASLKQTWKCSGMHLSRCLTLIVPPLVASWQHVS